MSGIFDLFGGNGNAVKNQSLSGPTETLKNSGTNTTMFGGGMAAKNVGLSRPKPKGLSIRSGNDLNISKLNINKSKSPTRKSPIKGFLKPQLGAIEGFPQSLSPRKEAKTLKMQIMKSKQLKATKVRSPDGNVMSERKQVEENIFKKPAAPKNQIRKCQVYPEPEKLAFDYDYEKDMNDFSLDTEFCKLLKLSKNSIQPFEDDGFESDPEPIRPSTPSALDVAIPAFDALDTHVEPSTLELPSLSDDEDFWD